ncbi:MAG: GMC family oxidoreductase [Verrucomicrobia bacterium]|nr:GMC family oxidoreductase [Verrucomicrobiota bacterium]
MHYFKILFMSILLCSQLASGSAHSSKSCRDDSQEMGTDTADYIIVGLGTAGSVLARYLSDPVHGKFKNSVLVLEAGINRSDDPVVAEGLAFFAQNADELAYSSKYTITKLCPDNNFALVGGAASEQYSSGRLWFGSSAHNFFLDVRGSSDRWDDLAKAVGNRQWKYKRLLPGMKFLETFHGTTTQPDDRGKHGPLQISQVTPLLTPGLFTNAVSDVTGAPILPDYNVPDGNTAVSTEQAYSTPDFLLRSYGRDFLPPSILQDDGTATDGRKLRVESNAFVHRVIFDGKKAIGVEYSKKDSEKTFVSYACKKVILCAGSPFSAAILQRSGIGPKDVLEQPAVNVEVLVDNPLVGTGLKEHYGILFAMTQPENPSDQITENVFSYSDGRNFFAPAGSGDNKRRFQAAYAPNLALLPAGLLTPLGLTPTQNAIGGFCWYLRPQSSGTAFIVDDSPFTQPDIRFMLYTDGDLSNPASDLSASVAAFNMIKAIADEAGLTMLYPPPSHFSSQQQLAQDAGGLLNFSETSVTNHYTGTCPMGTNISNSVISSKDLHVHEVEDLMVVDSSIYPFPETGNTAWQCYVAGLRGAKILGADVP